MPNFNERRPLYGFENEYNLNKIQVSRENFYEPL